MSTRLLWVTMVTEIKRKTVCFRSEGFCSSTIARFTPVPGLNGAFTVRDQIGRCAGYNCTFQTISFWCLSPLIKNTYYLHSYSVWVSISGL